MLSPDENVKCSPFALAPASGTAFLDVLSHYAAALVDFRRRSLYRNAICVFVLIVLGGPFAFCQTPDGRLLFSQHCAKCHGESGEGLSTDTTIVAPSLRAEHDPGTVMTAMEVGPSYMPRFGYVLSVPEMRAVADYVTHTIAVIPLQGGNLSEGGELFRAKCAVCHRSAGRGGALAFTGVNAPALTGVSAPIVAGVVRWGPGPMPSFPASILKDQQLASVAQYVEFVQHPPSPGGNPIGYYGPVAEGFAAWIGVGFVIAFTMWIEQGGKG